MPVQTVREIGELVARPILVAATGDPELSQAERSVCANAIPVLDAVLADLNPQNIIPQTGRRNAAVTNLRDTNRGLIAVDRAHENFAPTRIYNATDAFEEMAYLIAAQLPSDDVTF